MNELNNLTDAEFVQRLRQFLSQAERVDDPETPLFWSDGKIDREKTLALPCYQNFHF